MFDPVPGDPEDIRDEVIKMKNLAKTLRDQARILRKAEDGDALQGRYADKIREKSGELDKRFRETAGRYERVVGDLGKWADDLEEFQGRADRILSRAKQANEDHAADLKKKNAEAEKDGSEPPDFTDQSHLDTYRRQLSDVIADRDARAQAIAGNIGDDISDVLEDSAWENFADFLSTALDVIGYLGTVIAIAAIFCTPVGWLLTLATVLTVASLAGHLLLAVTGEGSWTDVAFDVIAIATLGLAKPAVAGLKAGHALTKNAATAAARTQKLRQHMQSSKNIRNFINRKIDHYGPDSPVGQAAMRDKAQLRMKGADDARAARQTEANTDVADTRGIVEKESRNLAHDVKRMKEQFGGDQAGGRAVDAAADKALANYDKFKLYWGTGTAVDGGDKLADNFTGAVGYEGYSDLKDVPTLEVGSQW